MTARQRRVARRSRKKRGTALLGLGIVGAALAVVALSAAVWVLSVATEAPPLEDLKPIDKGSNSIVYAADGTRLGVISSDVIRNPVKLGQVPDPVREATIAIEDASFYEHGGVDLGAIARAAVRNAEEGEVVEGGSTITQQLVKNLYTGQLDDRNLESKIQEAKLAEEVEAKFTKNEILERYLNSASYGTNGGRTAIGIKAAARQYFDKPVGRLNVKEAALLAGLPQAPSLHNPLLNRRAAKNRRDEVIRAMARQGFLSARRAERIAGSNLGVRPTTRYSKVKEQYFFDYVTQQLIDEYGVDRVREGGLRVRTTIDLELQETAREAVDRNLAGVGPSGAIVTIEARTGNVLAMVSNANYDDRKFNLAAQGQRQPGSAFKTMVLAAALDRGIDPGSTTYVSRSPMVINEPEFGEWEVNTFDGSSGGSMDIRTATIKSDNTVYAQLDLDVGPQKVANVARQMGIESELNGYPAEGIGGLEQGVTPLEMANAYATLANKGVRNRPNVITEVKFPNGKREEVGSGKKRKAFSDGVASEVTEILEANIKRGTGTRAEIGCPAAGKTGTTDNHRDAWFVGYTPRLSTAVWVGYPDEQIEMRSEFNGSPVAGGTYPAQIWGDYMASAKREFCGGFPKPDEQFQASSFKGKYARGGGNVSSGSGSSPSTPTEG
jgi:penicillin-binding protein 1A